MFQKVFCKIQSAYFVISFMLIIICFGIVAADSLNKICEGEFKLIPILNLAQYKTEYEIEEVIDPNPQAEAYIQQLNENGFGVSDPLWRFFRISTVIALCNIPLFHVLYSGGLRFSRFVRILVLTGGIGAVLLILASRIYVHGTYGRLELRFRYPVAWITLRDIIMIAILLGATTGIIKMLKRE